MPVSDEEFLFSDPYNNYLFSTRPDTEKYKSGYTDCAREVSRYLATPEPPPLPSVPTLTDSGSKARLLRHLDQCIAEIDTEICPVSITPILPQPQITPPPPNSNGANQQMNGGDKATPQGYYPNNMESLKKM